MSSEGSFRCEWSRHDVFEKLPNIILDNPRFDPASYSFIPQKYSGLLAGLTQVNRTTRVASVYTNARPGSDLCSTLLDIWVRLLGQQTRVISLGLVHTKA